MDDLALGQGLMEPRQCLHHFPIQPKGSLTATGDQQDGVFRIQSQFGTAERPFQGSELTANGRAGQDNPRGAQQSFGRFEANKTQRRHLGQPSNRFSGDGVAFMVENRPPEQQGGQGGSKACKTSHRKHGIRAIFKHPFETIQKSQGKKGKKSQPLS